MEWSHLGTWRLKVNRLVGRIDWMNFAPKETPGIPFGCYSSEKSAFCSKRDARQLERIFLLTFLMPGLPSGCFLFQTKRQAFQRKPRRSNGSPGAPTEALTIQRKP